MQILTINDLRRGDDTPNEHFEPDRMSIDRLSQMHGSCACGACAFEVSATPKARFICHCTICQAFTGKPFSDVTVVRAKDVTLTNEDQISFKKYRPPPNVSRGLCRKCGKPAVEYALFGPFKLFFIPSTNFQRQDLLPPVHMHIFYHRRLTDAQDYLPKYTGYFPSTVAIGKLLMGGV